MSARKKGAVLMAAAAVIVAAVGLWILFQPPEAGVVADLDPETRVLSFSPGPGCTIESLVLQDGTTSEWSHFTAPPFRYLIDDDHSFRIIFRYRDRWGREYDGEALVWIRGLPDEHFGGGHTVVIRPDPSLPGVIRGGTFTIPETDPCPICESFLERRLSQ